MPFQLQIACKRPAGASRLGWPCKLQTPEKSPAPCPGQGSSHEIMLTLIVSTPPCRAILYCAMTSISKVLSRSRHPISCSYVLGPLEKSLTYRLRCGWTAKTILAAFAISGKRAESAFHQSITSHDRSSTDRPSTGKPYTINRIITIIIYCTRSGDKAA